MGWGGRREGGSGWGTHVNPRLIHVNAWQKPLQYCKVISFQLIKINEKKNKTLPKKKAILTNITFQHLQKRVGKCLFISINPVSCFFFFFFYCGGFCHTLKWNSHGFTCVPHPNPPPASLSTRSLWVFPVHQVRALVSCIQPGLGICFTLDNIFIMKWVEEGVGTTHFILGIRPPVCILLETSMQKKTAVST